MDITILWVPLLLTFLAGLSTGFGSLIALFIGRKFKKSYLSFFLGFSAGVMVYVSFAELLPVAVREIGFIRANVAFFCGRILIGLIDFLVPHEYIEERLKVKSSADKKLMAAGIFTAVGIAIHNLPEGLAVFVGSVKTIALGIPLAFAIAVHNIPEGIAVSMPIYYATKSKSKAFLYSLASGIVEPIGALIGFLVFLPFMTPGRLELMLAFVAGIMVFISFDELLPLSLKPDETGVDHVHIAVMGVFLGMLFMTLSLSLF